MVKTRNSTENTEPQISDYVPLNYAARSSHHDSEEDDNYGYDTDDFDHSRMRERRKRAYRASFCRNDLEQIPTRRSERSRRKYRTEVHNEVTDGPLENQYFPRRSTRRTLQDASPAVGALPPSTEIAMAPISNGDLRRSSRQRKLMYGSFSQSQIDKELDLLADEEAMESEEVTWRQAPSTNENDCKDTENVDMYTRVKRDRRQVKRDMYGIPVPENTDEDDAQKTEDEGEVSTGETSNEEDDSNSNNNNHNRRRGYFLRENRPRTDLYEAPAIEPQARRRNPFIGDRSHSPRSHRLPHPDIYNSPARKKNQHRRHHKKRRAFHGDSSTSSSTGGKSDESEDDRRFERRKAKSMNKARNSHTAKIKPKTPSKIKNKAKANETDKSPSETVQSRCLPMNLSQDDVASGSLRDRVKIGSSLADVDPMNIDKSVTFDSVGGLGKHIRALKEMIVFPLLYPEVFDKFKITPPRGVLFYGPPGTGKTLVARALANECSQGDRRVAFFMRKGADCLSKWVGESERQLRLLFDQAYQMRPSIIFFDEIDGLAPVRSSRQDQIHSSIVSTLLALMDGLDNRGEIVVIGATNRIDSIDPALRRPGRFDREFLFPLPSGEARKQIMAIHTKEWNPKLSSHFLEELADKCVGYCGADLKALCTEAALHALRRRYPQIYTSDEKLQLDVSSIKIGAKDFHQGMQNIVPTSLRSLTSPARALSASIRPLLQTILNTTLEHVQRMFPDVLDQLAGLDTTDPSGTIHPEMYSDDDVDAPDIHEKAQRRGKESESGVGPFLNFSHHAHNSPSTHRPRLLLSGESGQGQSSYLGPAVLHSLEQLPVHVLDLPAMYAVSAKTPEESCAQVFREARRTSPSILYVPHIHDLWDVIGDTLRATFLNLLNDMEPSSPTLLLATCEIQHSQLPEQIQELFSVTSGAVVVMQDPTDSQREAYFRDLLLKQATKPPPSQRKVAERVMEDLPKAPPPKQRVLSASEIKKLQKVEENHLRELRLFLRDVINKLGRDRKFSIFTKPVDELEVPDYYEIIQQPMDLSTMMSKIDLHRYECVAEFMTDIDLICSNALEYNPDTDPNGRAIRHRACALRDTAQSIISAELDEEFEKQCVEIKEARKRRGESPIKNIPSYLATASGFSRRILGVAPASKVPTEAEHPNQLEPTVRKVVKRVLMKRSNKSHTSPWCKPTKRRRRVVITYVDQFGNEVDQDGNRLEQTGDEDDKSASPSKPSPHSDKDELTSTSKASPKSSPTSPKTKSPASSSQQENPAKSPTGQSQFKKRLRSTTDSEDQMDVNKKGIMSDSEQKAVGHSDGKPTKSSSTPALTASQKNALAILNRPVETLVVDVTQLEGLLHSVVLKTRGFNIEQCERLYSMMSQCVFHHRREFNKTQLIQDLKTTLNRFVKH